MYIYNFNLIICTSYHIYDLSSNNFSWKCHNCLLCSSSRISACIWKMKISEQNNGSNNIN